MYFLLQKKEAIYKNKLALTLKKNFKSTRASLYQEGPWSHARPSPQSYES